jgi:hypothetical protein
MKQSILILFLMGMVALWPSSIIRGTADLQTVEELSWYQCNPPEIIAQPQIVSLGVENYTLSPNAPSISAQDAGSCYMMYNVGTPQPVVTSAYVTPQNNVVGTTQISEGDGAPAVAIDPQTQDAITAFERDNDIWVAYELFHLIGAPGLWVDAFPVNMYDPSIPDEEFCRPHIGIGSSPVNGHQRLYVVAENRLFNGTNTWLKIGIADFCTTDLTMQSNFSWQFRSLDVPFTVAQDAQIFLDCLVTDETLTLMGYTEDAQLFACQIEGAGSGAMTYDITSIDFAVDNPVGSNGLPAFRMPDGTAHQLHFVPRYGSQFNLAYKQPGIFVFSSSLTLQPAVADSSINWMLYTYPKSFEYDPQTHSFSLCDLLIPGSNVHNWSPMIPWDFDENGQPDMCNDTGEVMSILFWPSDVLSEDFAHRFRTFAVNEHYHIALFPDATKMLLHSLGVPGMEQWADKSDIILSSSQYCRFSYYLNPIDNPMLNGMMPVGFDAAKTYDDQTIEYTMSFVDAAVMPTIPSQYDGNLYSMRVRHENVIHTPPCIDVDFPQHGDVLIMGQSYEIEYEANFTPSVPFSFNLYKGINVLMSFDSAVFTVPDTIPEGNDYVIRVKYGDAPMSVSGYSGIFTIEEGSAAGYTVPTPRITLANYPNPFNPNTEIRFQISDIRQIEHAQIDIFNTKGQKVKAIDVTLSLSKCDTGKDNDPSFDELRMKRAGSCQAYSTTWDGTDSNGQPVASGLYFYRLVAGSETLAQSKMMLLK